MRQNINTWTSVGSKNAFIALILNFVILSNLKRDKYIRIIWGPIQGKILKFKAEELGRPPWFAHKENENLDFQVNALLLFHIPVSHVLHRTLLSKETQAVHAHTWCVCGTPSAEPGNSHVEDI